MSDLQSKLGGVKFKPIDQNGPQAPSDWILLLGVIYPAAVVGIELVWRMCAEAFFDPMPTYGHVVAILFVPVSNLLIWSWLKNGGSDRTK